MNNEKEKVDTSRFAWYQPSSLVLYLKEMI